MPNSSKNKVHSCPFQALNLRGLQALAGDPTLRVTFLGVTRKVGDCENGKQLHSASGYNFNFTCLEERHFLPEVLFHI